MQPRCETIVDCADGHVAIRPTARANGVVPVDMMPATRMRRIRRRGHFRQQVGRKALQEALPTDVQPALVAHIQAAKDLQREVRFPALRDFVPVGIELTADDLHEHVVGIVVGQVVEFAHARRGNLHRA